MHTAAHTPEQQLSQVVDQNTVGASKQGDPNNKVTLLSKGGQQWGSYICRIHQVTADSSNISKYGF